MARGAEALMERQVSATQVTLAGFAAAVLCATAVAYGYYFIGLMFLIVNRLADGLDIRALDGAAPGVRATHHRHDPGECLDDASAIARHEIPHAGITPRIL